MDQHDYAAHERRMRHIRVGARPPQPAILAVLQRACRSAEFEHLADTITTETMNIAHHLRTAAERYEDHARTLRAQSVTDEHADGVHRLAFTFETQAAQCRALATALDEL